MMLYARPCAQQYPIWYTQLTLTETGIRTFRSPVFSLLGAKVPSGDLSQERNFPGTFTPGNECSRELVLLVVSSLFDHGKGCLQYADARCCSESNSKM